MRAVWKWLAIVPVTLIVVAISVLFFAERLIDSDYLKQQLKQHAAQAGYTLEVGELKWKLLPQIHLSLSDVAASAQADSSQLITLKNVSAYVSVRALLAKKLAIDELTLEALHVQQQQQTQVHLSRFNASIDDLNTEGRPFTIKGKINDSSWQAEILYDQQGAIRTQVAIQAEHLDVDAIAPAQTTAQAKPANKSQAAVQPATNSKNATAAEQPLGAALTALLQYPGDYTVAINYLRARGYEVADLNAAISIDGNTINLQQINLNAYQGSAAHTGKLVVTDNQALRFELAATYTGINVGAVTQAINPKNPAAAGGTLSGQAQFATQGRNTNELTHKLNGQLQLTIENTQINQFNLEQTICNGATDALKIAPINAQWLPHSQLARLQFDGRVQQGVLHIQQLQGELDSARLSGRGSVDIGRSIAGLRMDAQLTQAYKQANTCPAINQTLRDITWPLQCEGDYQNRAFGETCGVDKGKLQKLVAQRLLNKALGDEKSSVIDKLKNLFR